MHRHQRAPRRILRRVHAQQATGWAVARRGASSRPTTAHRERGGDVLRHVHVRGRQTPNASVNKPVYLVVHGHETHTQLKRETTATKSSHPANPTPIAQGPSQNSISKGRPRPRKRIRRLPPRAHINRG